MLDAMDLSVYLPKLARSNPVWDLVFGSVAGFAGKLVEFPFDTIKVRLQTQSLTSPIYNGPLHCFLTMTRKEGFSSLFRGISPPLVGAIIENSCLFFFYNRIQDLVLKSSNSSSLNIPQLALCGALSGAVVSTILTPVELIKCKLQVKSHSTSPFTVIHHVYKNAGLSGFYKGHYGTFIRESGGGAAWFGTYEYMCKLSMERKGVKSKDELSAWNLIGAGALAGMVKNVTLDV